MQYDHDIDEWDKMLVRDGLFYNLTEDILVIMENKGVTFEALGDKLGVCHHSLKDKITGLPDACGELTIDEIFNICYELGVNINVILRRCDMDMRMTLQGVISNPHCYTFDEIMGVLYRELPDLHDIITGALAKEYAKGYESYYDED